MWTDHDGMVAGRFRLTPEVGGQVKAAIDAQVRRIFREHKGSDHEPHAAYAADVLAAFVVRGGDATTRRDPNRPCTSSSTTVRSCAAAPPAARSARSPASAS